MVKDNVRARKVGESLVVTLTKPVLDKTGIAAGDQLLLETITNGRVIVRKEPPSMPATQSVELELEVLKKRQAALQAEVEYVVAQHNNSMPSHHPWVDDENIMEGQMKYMRWEIAKLDTAIAEKRLELYEIGGVETEG